MGYKGRLIGKIIVGGGGAKHKKNIRVRQNSGNEKKIIN